VRITIFIVCCFSGLMDFLSGEVFIHISKGTGNQGSGIFYW
jgi:hypothetical protein